MRKVICIEGVPFPGMRTLAMKGSIYLAENIEKIPITQAYNHEKILGYARNLQRNIETGEVSMDLVIHPSFDVNLDEFTATVTLTDVVDVHGGSFSCRGLTIGRAFFASYSGLRIYRAADPKNPRFSV